MSASERIPSERGGVRVRGEDTSGVGSSSASRGVRGVRVRRDESGKEEEEEPE